MIINLLATPLRIAAAIHSDAKLSGSDQLPKGAHLREHRIWLLACFVTVGCGTVDADKAVAAQVPSVIQAMMDIPLPADVQIHIRRRGHFTVKPRAAMCHLTASVSPELFRNAPRFYGPGLKGGESGALNEALQDGTPCKGDDANLTVYWKLINNRGGGPYKLILAVWQGDAAWVGYVERLNMRWHPTPRVSLPIEPKPDYVPRKDTLITGSVASDASDLSNTFTAFINGEEK